MIIGKTKTGEKLEINLLNLIETRMLITANSGGGKSWTIRRILEQTHGKVQQIVIDLEGEFGSLREKYDYLLVGKEGEIPANIRTAQLLARKILELRTSTIIDVSELKKHERILYVKRFLDSLIESPKKLWHPALIIIDECHQFAPQSGKSESSNSVIDLMTRGRKRGFCGIICTQRLSKLNKDAAAEANNILIGRTGLDVDMKRASEILGFTSKEQMRGLRNLGAGEFCGFGPAISKEVVKFKVGGVKTTHPRLGGQQLTVVPGTPKNIKRILKKLIDLEKESEEELRTKQDMKNKIMQLKRELTILKRQKPEARIDEKQLIMVKQQGIREAQIQYKKIEKQYEIEIRKLRTAIGRIKTICVSVPETKPLKPITPTPPLVVSDPKEFIEKIKRKREEPRVKKAWDRCKELAEPLYDEDKPLRAGAMRMLGWLAAANTLTKQRLATLSGFSVKGGTFNTYISELKRNGWITGMHELTITEEGIRNVNEIPRIPTGRELLELWKTKFRKGAGRILEVIYEHYPHSISKEEIGYETGFTPTGGTFNTYISELRRNGLIEIEGNELIISKEFFE